jgi:hypothetical protein
MPSSVCDTGGNPTRFVDHQLGTDDEAHGTSVGACAYRTLTYALAHATDAAISLATYDTYQGGVDGETLPFLLTGTQQLFCNGAVLENAADQGTYDGIVQFSGTTNGVTSCQFEGLDEGGYLLLVNSSGAGYDAPHGVANTVFRDGGNVALSVGAGFDNLVVTDSTFQTSFVGIYPTGSHANVRIVDNTFAAGGDGYDVVCDDAEPGVTGSGNSEGGAPIACGICGGCPFGP